MLTDRAGKKNVGALKMKTTRETRARLPTLVYPDHVHPPVLEKHHKTSTRLPFFENHVNLKSMKYGEVKR
jgi:hypothetical protein